MNDGVPHIDRRFTAKWPRAGQHLVKQDARGKDICARIHLVSARLFRRGVCRGAVWHADLRQFSLMNPGGRRFVFIDEFGQSEIEDLYLATVGNHHVAGFNIAMNDAARVCSRERIGDLNSYAEGAVQFQRPAITKLPHVAAFDVLHCDEVQSIVLIHVEDRADVRMIQSRGQPRLAFKAFDV